MGDDIGSVAGAVIGVGFGLAALNMLNRYDDNRERKNHTHSRCKYCNTRSTKIHKSNGIYCSYCKRRLI